MEESSPSFTADDLLGLDQVIRNKIKSLEETSRQAVEAEANWNRYKIGIEQSLYEVEQRLDAAQTQLEKETQSSVKLKEQLTFIESDRDERLKRLRELELRCDQAVVEKSDLQRRVGLMSQDKTDLNDLLAKRNEEIEGLRGEFTQMKSESKALLVQKCTMQVQLDEVQSKEIELGYREKRFEQERELASKEQEWLKNELASRDQNIFSLRKELSLKEVEAQSKISALQDQLTQMRFNYESGKNEQSKLTTQVEDLMKRLKDASDERYSMQESYERELQCKSKLADVYKESASESDSRIEELTKTLESQQQLFDESKQSFFSMQEELKAMVDEHENLMKEKVAEITSLKDELEKANELLRSQNRVMLTDEEVAAISPAAAAASRLIKSGVTLTSIYRDHCKVVQELDMEKLENRRIEAYFKELVQDIERNAPILKKQKEQYLECMDTVKRFKKQLQEVGEEKKQIINARDSALRQLSYTKAELERFQRDSSDLAAQVRTLLRCLEKARLGEEMPSLSDSQVLHGAEDLVLFRNIDEMQTNYQRLLSALREAEARREEIIKQTQDTEMSKLRQELEVAKHEVESLKDHREKQNLVVETISEQRETYKRLYQENLTPSDVQPEPMTVSPAKSIGNDESSRMLDRVSAEFDLYRKEKNETERLLNVKVDSLQEKVMELRSSNSKLNAEVEYQAERFKVLGGNNETHAKQVKVLEERLSASQAQSSKQEQCVSELTREVISGREMVGRLKAEKQSYIDQLQMSKSALQRVQIELDTVRKHSYSQESLALSLQELQARLDRTESEKTLKVTGELESIRTERNNLQKAYSNLNEQQQSYVRDSKGKLNELQTQLSEEETKNKHLSQKLNWSEEELKSTHNKLEQLQTQIEAFTSGDVSADRYQKESQQLQNRLNIQELELNEARTKLSSVMEQLKAAQSEISRHTQISSGLECSLKELTQSDKAERAALTSKLESTKIQFEGKETELSNLQGEKEELVRAMAQLRQEQTRACDEYNVKNNQLQSQVDMLNGELETWKGREAQAIADRDEQANRAAESENKLQNALNTSSELQLKLTRLETSVSDLQSQFLTQKGVYDENEAMITTQLNTTKGELNAATLEKQQLQNTLLDLESQNKSLYDQIEKLGTQLSVLEKYDNKETVAGETTALGEADSSVTPLMDVIKYAREERTKANERADKAETELIRIKAQHTTLEHEIDRVNKLYNEAKVEAEAFSATVNEKTMLSARLEALESVQQSNIKLMAEKQCLEAKNNSLEAEMNRTKSLLNSEESNLKKSRELYSASIVECTSLKQDVQSWKDRYEKLVEQRAQFDSQQITQLRKELQVSEVRMRELEQTKERQDGELREMKCKTDAMQADLDEFKSQVITQQDKISQAETDYSKQGSILKQARVLARKYKDQFETLQKVSAGGAVKGDSSDREKLLEGELARLREEVKSKLAQPTTSQSQVSNEAQKQELEKVNKEKADLQIELTEAKTKIGELERAGGGRPMMVRKMQERLKQVEEVLKQTSQVAQESKNKADELSAELVKTQSENETLRKGNDEERDALNERLLQAESIKSELEKQFAEQKARMDTLQSQFNRSREENKRLEQQTKCLNERPSTQTLCTPIQPVAAMPSLPDRPTAPTSGFNRNSNRVAAKVSGIVRATPGTSKARATVPPTSTVSPGPALPDQSNTRAAAAVPPIVVSTSQQASPSLPQAIVTPHIEPPQQQEAVSASTDAGSSGISSSSNTRARTSCIIDVVSDEASTSTDRKRRVPDESMSIPVKRIRADSPSQVSTSSHAYVINFEQEIAPDREADALGGDSNTGSGGPVESSLQDDDDDDDVMVVEEIRPTPASSAEVASSSSFRLDTPQHAPDASLAVDGGEVVGFDTAQLDVDDSIVPGYMDNREMSFPQSSSSGLQQMRDTPDFSSGFDAFPIASSNSDLNRDVPNARQSSPPQVCLDADNGASGEVGQSGLGSGIGIMIDDSEENFDAQGNFECELPHNMHLYDVVDDRESELDSGDDEEDDGIPQEIDDEEEDDNIEDIRDIDEEDDDDIHDIEEDDDDPDEQEMERAGEATPTPIEIETGGATDEEADVSEPSTSEQTNRKPIKIRRPIVYDLKADEPPELQQGPSGVQQAEQRRGTNRARRSITRGAGVRGRGRPPI